MSICFSGAYTDSNLAREVYNYFETKCYPEIANYVVELYHCDLTDDNVKGWQEKNDDEFLFCLLYTSPSPRDRTRSRMPSSA